MGAGLAADAVQEAAAADRLDVRHVVGQSQQRVQGRFSVVREEVGAREVDAMQEGGALEAAGRTVVGKWGQVFGGFGEEPSCVVGLAAASSTRAWPVSAATCSAVK
ncbi:hypothetical protein ABZ656_18580 [Streptomyces sp. NPDC007095]|uniref:hypothetical protein n=1 Tax=Streptomyces sp. NPDC007095 TaxID=3154482 RepID=UPI0034060E7E